MRSGDWRNPPHNAPCKGPCRWQTMSLSPLARHGLVAMGGWRTRRHETAPIDSAALFGLSFWVDRASTTCAADGRVLSSLCAPTLAPSKEFGSVWPSPRLRTAQESRLSKSAINVNRRATWPAVSFLLAPNLLTAETNRSFWGGVAGTTSYVRDRNLGHAEKRD